ncbi:MAG: PorP/SprF family type IX secretion system membrane protein [Bacteroidales bacterium]|nr:PorP/SprF family type IX secretion system membrane protein [Bacteroidales bacterium]
MLACLCALFSLPVRAQYDPAFNHYWNLHSFYNPAASGLSGQLNVQGAYALQMLGYTHAPATMIITADLPLWMIGPAHGLGAGFVNDKIGLFEHKRFFIQYAYHQNLWGGRLSAGVRGGLLAETFDGSGLDVIDSGDQAFPTSEVNGTAFDLDAGLRFDAKNWYAGFSVMHTLAPLVELGDNKTNEYEVPQAFYLTGGYNIRLRNPLLSMQTSAIVRTDLQNWRGDITARLCYKGPKGKLYLGAAYSPTISASLLIGGDFHGVQIGYCYECYTSGIGALQGTHELSIGYTTDLNLFKKGRNKHQSVRLL